MRTLDSAILAALQARTGLLARLLIWIVARDRSTGDDTPVGFWTGDDQQSFTIGGESRTYYGAGALISTPPLQAEVGLKVRSHRVTFSPLAPEVEQVIRGYDPRLAPSQMHVAYFDPDTHNLLAEPVRIFRGFVNTVSVTTPGVGGEASVEVEFLSSAHALTRKLALKKSDESLRRRAPTDGFRKYTTVTGAVQCLWGERRAAAPAGAPAQEPEAPATKDDAGSILYPGR